MPIWQLCANLLIPNCLRSNLSYSPLAALELYVKNPKLWIMEEPRKNTNLESYNYNHSLRIFYLSTISFC